MRKISMKQIKIQAELNGWKPFTEKEWCAGIRHEKDFYYSAGQYGINGLVFFANDDNVYYVIGRTSMLFKVMYGRKGYLQGLGIPANFPKVNPKCSKDFGGTTALNLILASVIMTFWLVYIVMKKRGIDVIRLLILCSVEHDEFKPRPLLAIVTRAERRIWNDYYILGTWTRLGLQAEGHTEKGASY